VTKLTRLTQKIAIQLHLVEKSYTICSPRSRLSVRKLLDTLSCTCKPGRERGILNKLDGEKSSPLETVSFSAGKDNLRLLWNPKFHYRLHKIPPLVPILSFKNPFRYLL